MKKTFKGEEVVKILKAAIVSVVFTLIASALVDAAYGLMGVFVFYLFAMSIPVALTVFGVYLFIAYRKTSIDKLKSTKALLVAAALLAVASTVLTLIGYVFWEDNRDRIFESATRITRPYLSNSASTSDTLHPNWSLDSDEVFRVGDDLFGYLAPLEKYTRIYTVGRSGKDTIESWIDYGDRARYDISLFDDAGNPVDSFYAYRTSSSSFEMSKFGVFPFLFSRFSSSQFINTSIS